PLAAPGGPELLPARRRPDPVGDFHHYAQAIGDAALAARPCLRHQHHELWCPPARLGARRHRRRPLRRGDVPLSGTRDLRRAGAGDLAVAGGGAGAATRHGRRARALLIPVLRMTGPRRPSAVSPATLYDIYHINSQEPSWPTRPLQSTLRPRPGKRLPRPC